MSRPPLLQRIAARAAGSTGQKAFTEPPFWTQPGAQLGWGTPWSGPDRERIGNDFMGYIEGGYKASGPVFAAISARQEIFAQARLAWLKYANGRPQDPFGTPELELLEKPWTNATTVDLLTRMEVVSSLAGNYYATVVDDSGKIGKAATGSGRRVVNIRPDWVTIVIHSPSKDPYDLRAKIAGYLYSPTGDVPGEDNAVLLMPDEICHYAPKPDPAARFRGMSWLTPIIREIQADRAATKHKDKFFTNGATLQTVVRFDKDLGGDAFTAFVEKFKAAHRGADHAYETLFLGGGADVTIVGADMKQLDFKSTQGAGETRIATAAGVHPAILGLSEGLQGSSLNAGNFGAARRLVADKTLKHLWLTAASSLQTLVTPPVGAVLTCDTRDVAFLREDQKDAADIQSKEAMTIRQLVDAGYDPASVVPAVQNGDWSLLKHSGLFSVQLQEAGTNQTSQSDKPPANAGGEKP